MIKAKLNIHSPGRKRHQEMKDRAVTKWEKLFIIFMIKYTFNDDVNKGKVSIIFQGNWL